MEKEEICRTWVQQTQDSEEIKPWKIAALKYFFYIHTTCDLLLKCFDETT